MPKYLLFFSFVVKKKKKVERESLARLHVEVYLSIVIAYYFNLRFIRPWDLEGYFLLRFMLVTYVTLINSQF